MNYFQFAKIQPFFDMNLKKLFFGFILLFILFHILVICIRL